MEPVPPAELNSRMTNLQQDLASQGISLALVRQYADLYYYTGAVVDGFLAAAPEGTPLLLVRRPQRRVEQDGTLWPTIFYRDLGEFPQLLAQAGLTPRGPVALELDVMPAGQYQRLRDQFFPQFPIKDLSPLIRRRRMVKSAYEIEQLRRTAALLDRAFAITPELLRPGMTELELAAALEYRLRVLGHQGPVRVRRWDLEIFYGHVLSGISGLTAAYTDTPSGGVGFSPAFPQGASLKTLAPGEPVSIDFAACLNGYVADMTRMYALKSLPPRAWEAYELVQDLFAIFESEARPGVLPGQLFHRLWDQVRARGFQESFMGRGPDRVAFLGHGVGLELDEFPLISARFPYPLEENVVLAFEPKFFLRDIGMVGREDTGRITPGGVEWLTQSPGGVTIL